MKSVVSDIADGWCVVIAQSLSIMLYFEAHFRSAPGYLSRKMRIASDATMPIYLSQDTQSAYWKADII